LTKILKIIAFRRRRAIFSNTEEKTGGGTSVISRYTLRLLTVQQFRRTLRLIQACEFLRVYQNPDKTIGWRPRDCLNNQNWLYGSTRFSIGMWVGGSVTPNFLRTEQGAIKILQGQTEGEGEPAQILRCPSCSSWLSFPKTGIPKGQNNLYFLVKIKEEETDEKVLKSKLVEKKLIEEAYSVDLFSTDIKQGYRVIKFSLNSESPISGQNIENFFSDLDELEVCSLNIQRPGYFASYVEPGRRSDDKYTDFFIMCLNPECDLNRYDTWKEGVVKPVKDSDTIRLEKFPDNLIEQILPHPFLKRKIPIVAYTVDEQIYSRCPSVIISTADKIARMAYEPRISSIFGDVTCYNPYYGYNKNQSLYRENTTTVQGRNLTTIVQPFKSPELIIQDELHLIGGPLGSMFGLYEASVDLVNNSKIKYIASTATISNADKQVKVLFNKKLALFPAYGINIGDSFFVKEHSGEMPWKKDKPGRIYMGVYCPGLGSLTPLIRIYARLLQTVYDNKDNQNFLRYFWTIVSYFNTIKELGGVESLFKEDIIERLRNIEPNNTRPLHIQSILELSSRIDSTEIPQVLEFIEKQGKSDKITSNTDVLLTTSMFGTGVDISHLSLMVLVGQPKTHSAYIQATGRVGRTKSGLVVTFYKNGRTRDLSHYEHFTDYHYRLHLEVEPISVSPFSSGTLDRILGPVVVSILRNLRKQNVNWFDNNAKIINSGSSQEDIEAIKEGLLQRFDDIYPEDKKGRERLERMFTSKINQWKQEMMIAEDKNEDYVFYEYCIYKDPEKNIVLGDSLHERFKKRVVFRNSPQSLRNVEDTIGFRVK